MEEKSNVNKNKGKSVSYWEYFITVAVIIALAVMVTVSLISCSVNEDLAAKLNEGLKEDYPFQENPLVEEEKMVCYLPDNNTTLSFVTGMPEKMWFGEFKEGKVKVKVQYDVGVLEEIDASYVENEVTLHFKDGSTFNLTFTEEKSHFSDGADRWTRVDG